MELLLARHGPEIFVPAGGYNVELPGGGWPQPKGSGYYKLGQNWIIADSCYGPEGGIFKYEALTAELSLHRIYI